MWHLYIILAVDNSRNVTLLLYTLYNIVDEREGERIEFNGVRKLFRVLHAAASAHDVRLHVEFLCLFLLARKVS